MSEDRDEYGYIKRSKSIVKIGNSFGIILDKTIVKELNLKEDDEIIIFMKKRAKLKQYFCLIHKYLFTCNEAEIEDVFCPICGENTVKEINSKNLDSIEIEGGEEDE